ncbi:hypothetical protein P4O66_022177, partial [Electrophorus voltai]
MLQRQSPSLRKNDQVLCLIVADVRQTLRGVNPRKGRVLRECADQLADVLTDIFNISLSCTIVPTCFKITTIIPVPKKPTVSCLSDYHPITLASIIMKCFERLVMRHIKTQLPASLELLQFSYRSNQSTDDAISTTLQILNHMKFADDMNVVGLINKDDESAYREEVQELVSWCKLNNLHLNVNKTKKMVVDFRKARQDHSLLTINGSSVEMVKNTKFFGVHLTENLTWTLNTSSITKRAQQRLYFLQKLRKAHLPSPILTTFYRGTRGSILSRCITTWFGNYTIFDCKTLQRIMRTAEKINEISLPAITDITQHI